ncbi:hypothetical protein [Brasilonema sp. UFV-L1]|uniref:TRADD-N-associated membrane domain-containing protein n=1 Tax=Brasilonema sp. UFV-L1 TaxID=2234130 RepID=UPI00145ED2C4|nr:hypothetical protein [Brasilonema sp. UFV-L1]NMG07405.1 hypothetical protein [Brasilonema sp. UFV-L1]
MYDQQIQKMMSEELFSIYRQQRLQDRKAFNLAYSLTILGAIIGIASVVLLLSGKVSEGAFTATAGGMYTFVSTSWRKMTKDTDDSLEKVARALEDKLTKTNR